MGVPRGETSILRSQELHKRESHGFSPSVSHRLDHEVSLTSVSSEARTYRRQLMRIVETMVPRDGRGPPTNSDEYYFAIRDLFPHVPPENDVLGRLLCFAMRMCLLRIEKNPNPTAH